MRFACLIKSNRTNTKLQTQGDFVQYTYPKWTRSIKVTEFIKEVS